MLINKRIIPVLLLQDNTLHKTVKFKNPAYVGEPLNVLRIFNEKEADEIILLDIRSKVRSEGPNFDVLQNIAEEMFSPIAYGGGINSLKQVEKILSLGFEKVTICTALYENPLFIKQCIQEFGAQAIIASVDFKKNIFGSSYVYISGGTKRQKCGLYEYLKFVDDLGVGEIFVSDISRDGTLQGYNVDFFKEISKILRTPVIACGGAKSILDIQNLFANTEVNAAAAGAFFIYHGEKRAVLVTYPTRKERLGIFNAYAK